MPEPTDHKISTRAILIGAIALNVIAVGSSEIQRRAIFEQSHDEVVRFDQRNAERVEDLGKKVSDGQTQVQFLQKIIEETKKQVSILQWTLETIQLRHGSSENVSQQQFDVQLANRLNEGREIILQFDWNDSEDRDDLDNVRCGSGTDKGYLGIFIAAQRYSISFDKTTHKWIGTGPRQDVAYDPKTGSCGNYTATYGPQQIGTDVQPGTGDLVLWGAPFKLKGHDVFQSDQKVGTVGWLN